MRRIVLPLSISLLFMAATRAPATMLRFIPGTIPEGENALVLLDDGLFELSDTPNAAPNDFQYEATDSFNIQVTASDGAGGSAPFDFSLLRGSTTDGRLNLIFGSPDQSNLLLWFDVPGLTKGDPIPSAPLTDADGLVRWNAPSLTPPSGSSPMLAGALEGGSVQVPEPMGGLALLVGLCVLVRHGRRQSVGS